MSSIQCHCLDYILFLWSHLHLFYQLSTDNTCAVLCFLVLYYTNFSPAFRIIWETYCNSLQKITADRNDVFDPILFFTLWLYRLMFDSLSICDIVLRFRNKMNPKYFGIRWSATPHTILNHQKQEISMVWGVALQRILKYLGFILFRNRNIVLCSLLSFQQWVSGFVFHIASPLSIIYALSPFLLSLFRCFTMRRIQGSF